MKKLLIVLSLLLSELSPAQFDTLTIEKDSTQLPKPELSFNGYLLSRNIWRGVNFGASPSIQGLMSFGGGKLALSGFFSRSMNGGSYGYKSTSNIFLSYRPVKGLLIEVDDYFFYDEDNLEQYANWSDTTLHFIEGRLRFEHGKLYLTSAYTLHANENYDNQALYIEIGYSPRKDISIVIGGLTGPSSLNFRKYGGVTNISITKRREIRVSDEFSLSLYGSLVVDPSYKSVVTEESGEPNGVVASAISFVLGVSF